MVLRELLASFGLKFDEKAVEHASEKIEDLKKKAEGLLGVIAGGELVRGFAEMIEKVIDTGDELETTASKIGITTDALQEMRFAAKLNNVEAGELDNALFKLGKRAAMAAAGSKTAADGFDVLKISLDGIGEIPTDEIFGKVADGLMSIKDPGEQSRVAFEVMGAAGGALIPILKGGSKGIEELRKKARELGGVMSEKTVKAAAALDEKLKGLAWAFNGVKTAIVEQVLPAVDYLLTKAGGLVHWFRKLEDETSIIKDALLSLGAVATAIGLVLLAPFLPFLLTMLMAGVAVAAVAIGISALRQALNGGPDDSQSWIDAIFGIGTKAKVTTFAVKALRESLLALRDVFSGDLGKNLADYLDANGDHADAARHQARFAGITPFDPNRKTPPKSLFRTAQTDREADRGVFGSIGHFLSSDIPGTESWHLPGSHSPSQVTINNAFQIDGARDPGAVAGEVAQQGAAALTKALADTHDALKQKKPKE